MPWKWPSTLSAERRLPVSEQGFRRWHPGERSASNARLLDIAASQRLLRDVKLPLRPRDRNRQHATLNRHRPFV